MRYVTKRPRQDKGDWDAEEWHTAGQVIEEDRDTFSGLYDKHGNELHREREPIGFRVVRS